MGRLLLYFHTMRYMKPSQIFCRMKKSLGYACSLGCSIQPLISKQVANVASIEELDFDSAFLARFNVNELMEDHADDKNAEFIDTNPLVEDIVSDHLLLEQLYQQLDQLIPNGARVFQMRANHFSEREIAQALGIKAQSTLN